MPRPRRTSSSPVPRPHPFAHAGVAGVVVVVALAGCSPTPSPAAARATVTATSTPSAAPSTASPTAGARAALSAVTDVVTGLAAPWSAVALPDGSLLVSERDAAAVTRVEKDGARTALGMVTGVVPGGEGGLLGLAVERGTFTATPVVYAYITAEGDNRVVRMALDAQGRLGPPTAILTGIPKAGNHNGGRLAFGPDGFLYVTTGDANIRSNAQDVDSLGGKILRITTDGSPAPDNPFPGSPVWSYGHRNVQGIAWDASGRMWASEFGQDTWDELNVITRGSNYGWPTVEGAEARDGLVDPVRQWRPDEASPSGIAIGPDGSVLLAALKGESLWKVPVNGDGSTGQPQRLVQGDYGRVRDVLLGPDGNVWIVTNNTSRGTPRAGDDRIVALPQSLTG